MAAETAVIEVAETAEKVARTINGSVVSAFTGGMLFGGVVGAFFGYRYANKKLRAEILAEAREEIEEIREIYRSKALVRQEKPAAEEIVEKMGYIVPTTPERPTRPPVPVEEPRHTAYHRALDEPEPEPVQERLYRTEEGAKDKNAGWFFPREMQLRTPREPHVIHQDEYTTNETDYSQATLVYYAGDGVLADEDGSVITNPRELVGAVFNKFGHGSDDSNIVYVRNSALELEWEICRVPDSYQDMVEGVGPDDASG